VDSVNATRTSRGPALELLLMVRGAPLRLCCTQRHWRMGCARIQPQHTSGALCPRQLDASRAGAAQRHLRPGIGWPFLRCAPNTACTAPVWCTCRACGRGGRGGPVGGMGPRAGEHQVTPHGARQLAGAVWPGGCWVEGARLSARMPGRMPCGARQLSRAARLSRRTVTTMPCGARQLSGAVWTGGRVPIVACVQNQAGPAPACQLLGTASLCQHRVADAIARRDLRLMIHAHCQVLLG